MYIFAVLQTGYLQDLVGSEIYKAQKHRERSLGLKRSAAVTHTKHLLNPQLTLKTGGLKGIKPQNVDF